MNEQNKLSSNINGITNNILVKNIYLSLGADIINVEDNVLKLYTSDSLSFNDKDTTSVHNNDKNLEIKLKSLCMVLPVMLPGIVYFIHRN